MPGGGLSVTSVHGPGCADLMVMSTRTHTGEESLGGAPEASLALQGMPSVPMAYGYAHLHSNLQLVAHAKFTYVMRSVRRRTVRAACMHNCSIAHMHGRRLGRRIEAQVGDRERVVFYF